MCVDAPVKRRVRVVVPQGWKQLCAALLRRVRIVLSLMVPVSVEDLSRALVTSIVPRLFLCLTQQSRWRDTNGSALSNESPDLL